MAFTHWHINAYVIVGGDSDFVSLVEKLKRSRQKGVRGGRARLHQHDPAAQLPASSSPTRTWPACARPPLSGTADAGRGGQRADRAGAAGGPARAEDSQRRPRGHAADRPAEEHAAPARLDLLRTQLRASSFLDFVEKLAASGFVQLKTSGRSVMVELNPGYTEESRPATKRGRRRGCAGGARRVAGTRRRRSRPAALSRWARWSLPATTTAAAVSGPRATARTAAASRNRPVRRSAIRPTACVAPPFSAPPPGRAGRCTCATSNESCRQEQKASMSAATASAA